MIVYLSSYPRSGNIWLISIIGNMLGRLSVDIHYDKRIELEEYASSSYAWYRIRVKPFPSLGHFEVDELRASLILYQHELSPHAHTGLMPGGLDRIVQREYIRKALAADQEVYFFKTHFLPFDKYFPGEKVIQIVRHPGASIWSYYLFLNRTGYSAFSLEDVIAGKVPFGGWSDYHQKWLKTADSLGNQYFRLRYEDLFGHEEEYGHRIGEWIGLPVLRGSVPSFSYFHSLDSNLVRKGDPNDWKMHFSERQRTMLFALHSATMNLLGYSKEEDAMD